VGLRDRFNRGHVGTHFAGATSAAAPASAGPTVADALVTARLRPAPASTTKAGANEVWGRPARCPECNGPGYLDRIDLVRRIQFEHCPDCFHRWSVAEADAEHLS
jgi:hypothetical protein